MPKSTRSSSPQRGRLICSLGREPVVNGALYPPLFFSPIGASEAVESIAPLGLNRRERRCGGRPYPGLAPLGYYHAPRWGSNGTRRPGLRITPRNILRPDATDLLTLPSPAARRGKGKRVGLPWGTGECGYRPHWHKGKGSEKIGIASPEILCRITDISGDTVPISPTSAAGLDAAIS